MSEAVDQRALRIESELAIGVTKQIIHAMKEYLNGEYYMARASGVECLGFAEAIILVESFLPTDDLNKENE